MAIIRFFRHNGMGQGKADSPTCYIHGPRAALTDEQRNKYHELTEILNDARGRGDSDTVKEVLWERDLIVGKLRKPAPVALSSNRAVVEYAIAHSPHKYKYSSGVIAYAKEDNATLNANPAIAREFRELFEALVFAGLPEEDRLIEWVQHTHEGNLENHFVIPRINLQTQKYFNPHPPGAEKDFNAIRDYLNAKYQLASPDDPKRQRKINQQPPRGPYPDLKIYLSNVISDMAADGELTNRQQVIDWLNQKETRQLYGIVSVEAKRDYLRVMTQGNQKAIRLRGQLCGQPGAMPEPTPALKLDLTVFANRVNEVIAKRSQFNRKRYNITAPLNPPKQLTIQPISLAGVTHTSSGMSDNKLDPICQQDGGNAQQEQAQQAALRKQDTMSARASVLTQQQSQNTQKQQLGTGYEPLTTRGIDSTESCTQRAGDPFRATRPNSATAASALFAARSATAMGQGANRATDGVSGIAKPQRAEDPFRATRPSSTTAARALFAARSEAAMGQGANRATDRVSEIAKDFDIAIEQTHRAVERAASAVAHTDRAIDQATRAGDTFASRTRKLSDKLEQLAGKLKDNIRTLTRWITNLYRDADLEASRPNTTGLAPGQMAEQDSKQIPTTKPMRVKVRPSEESEYLM